MMRTAVALVLGTVVLGTAITAPAKAQNFLTDGDFEGCIPGDNYNLGTGFSVGNAATHDKWLDVNQWLCSAEDLLTGSDGQFAKQTTFSANGSTNLLFQGFPIDTSELDIGAGPEMLLCFDYINQNSEGDSNTPEARIYRFAAGGTLSQFAPWPTANQNGLDIMSLNLNQPNWTHDTMDVNVEEADEAIVVAFKFGFNSNALVPPVDLHGVDNVELVTLPLAPYLDVDPDTLNPGSQGNFITVYIGDLGGCFGVDDIDPTTVELTEIDGVPLGSPLSVVQWDFQDGILMVKFSREELVSALVGEGAPTGIVSLMVEGEVDGVSFAAEDDINVLDKY